MRVPPRESPPPPPSPEKRLKVLICRGPQCGDQRDSARVHRELVAQLRAAPVPGATVEIAWHSCFGQCAHGPNVLVREVQPGENSLLLSMMPTMAPGAVLYHGVQPQDVPRLIAEHLKSGQVLSDLTRKDRPDR